MLPRFERQHHQHLHQFLQMQNHNPCHQCSPSSWWGLHQVEQIRQGSPAHLLPESTSDQLASQQSMSSPHTPGTPSSSDLNSELATRGNNSGVTCPSPNYVTITTTNGTDGGRGVHNLSYASLTPIKASAVDGGDDEVNGSYVTYVDESEHQLYAAASGPPSESNAFSVYTVGEAGQLYHGAGATPYYAAPSGNIGLSYSQQTDNNAEVQYAVSPANNNSCDAPNANLVGQPVTHAATRVSPATVQWLIDNYETAEGVSLPRSTLYYHYIKHTDEHSLDPVNAASFGKLIRSVFLGLRTRRLGTRGNSKYHYYGIRLKPSSPLNALDDKAIDAIMSSRYNPHKNQANSISLQSTPTSRLADLSPTVTTKLNPIGSSGKRLKLSKASENTEIPNSISQSDGPSIQQFLGNSSHVISSLPEMDVKIQLPEGLREEDLSIFHSLYRELCSKLLADMMTFQFSDFQQRWRIFFRTEKSSSYPEEQLRHETLLPKSKLHALCELRHVQDYVQKTDYQLYQNLAMILLPDVLRPIPSAMTQTIRNFAKVVENCMASAMAGFPEEMISVKLSVLSAFGQTLRRHTSLNHLAQAARAVLQNEAQISQMLSDLNRVDFGNVEDQASWVCGCNSDIVPNLEADFKAALAQHHSLEEWAHWLESVVDRILRPYENTPRYTTVARYFLLKWSFYSSLVIRELTLRSAASFGSFHLLRLLYDEYMFYLVENRVARAVNTLPIAVMTKKLLGPLQLDSLGVDEDSDPCESISTRKDSQSQLFENSENEFQFHHDQASSRESTSSTGNSIAGTSPSIMPPETSPNSNLSVVPITSPKNSGAVSPTLCIKRDYKQRLRNAIV